MLCDNCQTKVTPAEKDPSKYYCPNCVAVFEITDAGTKAVDLDPLSAIKKNQGSFDERLAKLEKAKRDQLEDPEPPADPEPDDDDDDEGGLTIEFGGDDNEDE